MTATTIDLSKAFKSKKIALKKNSSDEIVFKNDVSGQIEFSESGNDLIITVFKAESGRYTYTKFVDSYKKLNPEGSSYQLTTTKYLYNKDTSNWQIVNKPVSKNIAKNNVPQEVLDSFEADIEKEEQLFCRYIQNYTYGSAISISSLEEDYLVDSIDEKDASYKADVIVPTGFSDSTLTYKILGTITISDGAKANSLKFTSDKNNNYENLLAETFAPVKKGNKYTGTYLNETVMQSDKSETFSLNKGKDEIIYDFNDSYIKAGKDIVNLVDGETLTLNIRNYINESEINGFEITKNFSKSKDDLIIKFTKFQTLVSGQTLTTDFGQITVKNYFKIAKDNLFIKYNDDETTKESVKDILEFVDGIGFIGDSDLKSNQKLTGNFVNQVFFGGSGDDTIRAVGGNNIIIAGTGNDKIYGGSGTDDVAIYSGDAKYDISGINKGDILYNFTSSDSLTFINYDEDWEMENDLDNLTFKKSGDDFILYHEGTTEQNRVVDKVVFSNYFKSSNQLKLINDVDITTANLDVEQKAKGKIFGTRYNDIITTTGASTISTGSGNDILTLKTNKNDTINLTGTGEKTIIFDAQQNSKIKFNKTINFKNSEANLKISFPYTDAIDEADEKNNYRAYYKKGKNLVIGLADNDFTTSKMKLTKNPDAKYTINNYFSTKDNNGTYTYEDNISVILPDNEQGELTVDSLKNEINKFGLIQCGNANLSSKYSDTCYNDVIKGGNLKDTYNVSHGGDDIIYDAKGNDVYKVANIRNSLTIYDSSGKDTLNITNVNNFGLYFDITLDEYNKIASVGSEFKIFDTTMIEDGEINGGVTIKNYFGTYRNNKVTTSKGCIETINIGTNKLTANVNAIANNVASWLTEKGYSSSADVFENHQDDIGTMINVYTTGRA